MIVHVLDRDNAGESVHVVDHVLFDSKARTVDLIGKDRGSKSTYPFNGLERVTIFDHGVEILKRRF